MKYSDYINGDSWKQRSQDFLNKKVICEICRKWPSTHAHHVSYKNIGNENDEDLQALCERCHSHLHLMPPNIQNKEQLKKSIKIMNYFTKQPRIKTLVLNNISEKYYNGRFMIDISEERFGGNTAFLNQCLIEMFYEDGNSLGIDIIEEAYALCIRYKINAAKNANKNKKDLEDRTKKYESGELKYIDIRYTTTVKIKQTPQELDEEKMKSYCLSRISDRVNLKNAKSFANKEYYQGKVYFNKEGIVTAAQLYLKLRNDGFHIDFYKALGGE